MGFSRLAANVPAAMLAALLAAPTSAKTLVYCSEGSPEGFTPALYTSGTTFDATSRQIFNRLVEFKRGTVDPVPGLAASWDISADGLTYTFHLRHGVKFHTTPWFTPTRDFDADDVLFSFNRQWKPEDPWHSVSHSNFSYFNSMALPQLLKSISKADDYTVVFTLNRPEAPFISELGMDFASIQSAEFADKMMKAGTPEKFDHFPVGTGPFVFVNYQPDSVIRYAANPDYWNGRPKIDNLVFAITPDPSVRFAKLKANECQIIALPNPADLPAMKADPNLKVLSGPALNIGYWAFNTEKKPFDDARVRRAMAMAIDKKAILQSVYLGTGVNAVNLIPPNLWSYNSAVKDYPYDPAQAKKLLADAGYPNGFSTDIWAMPVQRPYNPNAKRMAESIQADLAKIGVTARIVTYEWGEYLKRVQEGDHQTVLLGWSADIGDPDNFFYVLLSCEAAKAGSTTRWCNKDYDDLVTRAKQLTTREQRTPLYEQAQVIMKQESPLVTIAHSVVSVPMRKDVVGFQLSPLGSPHYFDQVDLLPASEKK
ncbi:MAG TPA: ABC transporter substrate-binding protein [Acetobacteraceae bacterium]